MERELNRACHPRAFPSARAGAGRSGDGASLRGWRRPLAVSLVVLVLLGGGAAPGAGAVSYTVETNTGGGRLTDTIRGEGFAASFDVPVESHEIIAALSLAPGTEFRLTAEATQIARGHDPTQPGSSLLRGEAWVGLPPWPLALSVFHQSASWQWALDGADEQIPFSAAGWGVGMESRLAFTPNLVVGAGLRATPWAHWTDEDLEATDPHRLFFLGYDLDARYFLSPSVALRAGYRWDTLRAVAHNGATRDIARSRLFAGIALGF